MASATESPKKDANSKKARKPTRPIPTNRIAIAKQFDILRAFGAVSESDGKATNVEVAKVVNLHQATVGLITPFFVDIGLLEKTSDGAIPCDEVCDFTGAYEWNRDTAFHRVSPVLQRTWFYEAIQAKLRFSPLTRSQAIQELALVANAAPEYRAQLGTLLEYLSEAGLVSIDNDTVRLSRPNTNGNEPTHEAPQREQPESAPSRHQASLGTTFSNPTAGIVQFNISVKVDMAELASWESDRIAAFFAGIAQVLAAKGAIEESAAGV